MRHKANGFTLVEVVVSLAVLSLILLATVSALRTFANTQVSLDAMMGRVDEVRTVSGFVRDMFEGSVAGEQQGGGLSFGGRGGSGLAYFEATPQWVEWKAPVLFGEVYGGTQLLRLIKEEGALKLYWQDPPAQSARVNWTGKSSRVLVNAVEEFQVSFKPEFNAAWQNDEWTGEGAPALVRLSIKAAGRYWPDLIVQVQR
ncbi:MAG: general secretion pathway protein J [Halioglobus sp.]|jgi:general secretion pathway protein J